MKMRIKCGSCTATSIFDRKPKIKKSIRRTYIEYYAGQGCKEILRYFALYENKSLEEYLKLASVNMRDVSLDETNEISYINCNMCGEKIVIKLVGV